jgi:CubicO group peptidase (beta-lactamase class C family)
MSSPFTRRPTRAPGLVSFALAALLAFTSVHTNAADRVLPKTEPEKVGISSERLTRITEMNRSYVAAGKLAGTVTLVARDGKIVYFDAQGTTDISTGAPMRTDSLFRIYSMTKPITSVAALMLYEEGRFQLRDPISQYLPEFKEMQVMRADGTLAPAGAITVQQLLTHTAGFSYGFSNTDPVDKLYRERELLAAPSLDAFVERLAGIPLRYEPGTRWAYSVAVDVTGALIERLSGQRLDRFLHDRLFEPLGMRDTFFEVPADKLARFGVNHVWDPTAGKLSVLPEQPYPRYQGTTFLSGGGGLVSTAEDYARFAEMLRAGGQLGDVRLLGPKTVQLMTMNHLPAVIADADGKRAEIEDEDEHRGAGFGLGVAVVEDVPASGESGSVGEFGWGGAAGTEFWVDPMEDLVVVGMIQLVQTPWPWRAELKSLTYQALTELR